MQEAKEMQAGKVNGSTGCWTRPGWSSGRQEAGETSRSLLGRGRQTGSGGWCRRFVLSLGERDTLITV